MFVSKWMTSGMDGIHNDNEISIYFILQKINLLFAFIGAFFALSIAFFVSMCYYKYTLLIE